MRTHKFSSRLSLIGTPQIFIRNTFQNIKKLLACPQMIRRSAEGSQVLRRIGEGPQILRRFVNCIFVSYERTNK